MEEDLPHPDPESQYSGTNAHLEMLKDMLMTYNMYDNKKVGMTPKTLSFLFSRLHGPHGTLPFPLSTLPRNHPPPSILLI